MSGSKNTRLGSVFSVNQSMRCTRRELGLAGSLKKLKLFCSGVQVVAQALGRQGRADEVVVVGRDLPVGEQVGAASPPTGSPAVPIIVCPSVWAMSICACRASAGLTIAAEAARVGAERDSPALSR